MAVQYFEESYSLDDFATVTDTTITDDEFRTVETLDVAKGEGVVVGQGQERSQTDAVGRIFLDIENDGDTDVSGKVRLVALNSQNRVVTVLYQSQISSVNVGANDRSARRPLPVKTPELREPYKLGIQVQQASGTDQYSSSNSTVEIDGYRAEKIN